MERNRYDADFAADSDYGDGFEESDAARWERLSDGDPTPFDAPAPDRLAGKNISKEAYMEDIRARIAGGELSEETRPYMTDEQASDMLLKEQEDAEYRGADEGMSL